MADIIDLSERLKQDQRLVIDWLNSFESLVIIGRVSGETGDIEVHYSADDTLAALGLLTYGAWTIMDPDE